MTTKDRFLSLTDKERGFVNSDSNQNLANLNLNPSHLSPDLVVSKISSTFDCNKINENNDYGNDESLKKSIDLKGKENKSAEKLRPSEYLDLHDSEGERTFNKDKKRWKKKDSTSANNSTLSLHISAYENAIKSDDQKNVSVALVKKGAFSNSCKNVEQFLVGTSSIMGCFEFPRQQQDTVMEPEMMQFTASQRLRNANDDTNKENLPSGSQKSKNSVASLTKEQRQERMPLTETVLYVCDRVEVLSKFLKEEESVQKLPICNMDFIHLCRFIEAHFIDFELNGLDDKIQGYKMQAGVVLTFTGLIQPRLPKEVIIWIICVYINLISKRAFGDPLSGTLIDHVNKLSTHLSVEYREKFGEEIIDQWTNLLSGSKSFCLNEQWMKHFYDDDKNLSFDLSPIKIQFEDGDNEQKICVLRCLLQFFLYGSFDFSQLPDEKLAHLFLCLFKDAFNYRITNLIISLFHKLISDDRCHGVFFMSCVDLLFSFLDFYHREPLSPGSLEAQEKPLIENSIKSCLDKIASIIVLPSSMKQVSRCKPSTFLPFAARGIDLLLTFKLDNPTLLKFVVNSLKNLSDTDSLGEFNHLPDSCKQLLRHLIIHCDEKNADIGYISELFSFLIKFKGDSNTSNFIDNLLQTASTNDKKSTVYINVRNILISVLTPLQNAKQFLAKVVPNEEEILQLFQDLINAKIDSKYLSASFNVFAKSADFYNGKSDTLLSFLSLPWICDIGWQIWEDFKKALPLLVPIKTAEDKYKTLLSTSFMKSISLKALSQISAKDQWRSYIFKEALYSSEVEIRIAALDALPYLLKTIPSYSFFEVLTPLIESLANEDKIAVSSDLISIVQSLISSISLCICVSGNQCKIQPDKQMCCNLCQTKEGQRKSVRIVFPFAAFSLLTKIVEIEEEENELKIDFINLLSSTVRHIYVNDDSVEALIKLSLPLISAGSGISISYLDFVEEAIQYNLSEKIINSLHEQIYFLQDDLLQLDYFIICALYSAKPDFAFNCVLEVVGKATIRTSRSQKAVDKAITMINVLSDREKISRRTYFIRNVMKFCQYIVRRLLNSLVQIMSDENIPEDEHQISCDSIIENCFASMAVVFDIVSKKENEDASKAFLNLAVDFLLPPLFMFKNNQAPYFEIIFIKICDTLKKIKSSVIKNSLPRMIWYQCYFRNVSWSDSFFHRVQGFSHGVNISTMITANYMKCLSAIVLSMGKNEEGAKTYLSKIFDVDPELKSKTFEFTKALRSNYLGILLELRRTFSDEMYYHHRHDIIKSVTALINNLDTEFFSNTPGRMLTVLKALQPIELSIDAWMAFLQRMDPPKLENQIHHVLIAAAPLIDLPGAKKIFDYIFAVRKKADPMKSPCQRFDRAVFVLYGQEKRLMLDNCTSVVKDEEPLIRCAKMLVEESPDVHQLVLPKILQMLENAELSFDIFDELIHALLHALKASPATQIRRLIGICIGKIGAIDPGKISVASGENSKSIDRRPLPLKFVDKSEEFFEEILEFCAKLLIECSDATKVDFIAMAVQMILKELNSPDMDKVKKTVFASIKEETKHEILPYSTTRFTATIKDRPTVTPQPYADHSSSYSDWLWRWYFEASDKIKDLRLSRIFRAMQFIYYSDDTKVARSMLSQVVLQALLENNVAIIEEARTEIFGVFKKALISDGWIRMAAQTCFQMIEFIEKFEVSRANPAFRKPSPSERDRVKLFLKKAVGGLCEESGELLSVAVAEKYNFACRALRWLEQYGIKVAPNGTVEFNRAAMYALERIYLQLSDTDGVLGAYETIQNHITASPQERVVAFEATGDHTEALPLYQQNPVQKLPLVKCLLRLNQPLIAYNLAGSFTNDEKDEKIKYKLRDYQIEAAYRQGEWQNLNEILKDTTEVTNRISSWGAHVASIFAGIQDKSKEIFEKRIDNARMQIMDSLKAVTMEGADTYSQAYRYIQRLHILYEIEDASESMKLFNPPSIQNCNRLIEKWDARSDNAIQCSSILEPIYWVRRELLRFADPIKNKDKISHYLIESCKLSRQANHLSTSWAYLIHARSLGVEKNLNIDMEEARYFFQRGQKGEAICSLQKTLEKHFPRLVEKLKTYSSKKPDDYAGGAKKVADELKLSTQDRIDFVNTQLQLTEYLEKSNASNIGDMYVQYCFTEKIVDKNEQQAYSFAVFYDNAYYSRNSEDSANVFTLLQLYTRVLGFGRRYLLHVMPRMLTIWLDFAAVMHEKAQKQQPAPPPLPPGGKKKKLAAAAAPKPSPIKYDSQEATDYISKQYTRFPPFYWFTAFPQLISRLCHPVESVYKVLESFIVELMCEFPHESLWQAIASYRTLQKEDHVRYERTRQTFRIAINKYKGPYDLGKLATNYRTFAQLLIAIAEHGGDKCVHGEFNNFKETFPEICKFLKNTDVKITVPFIAMVEKKMPTFLASQISLPDSTDDSKVFIKGFEENYKVFSSMEKPKLITMIGTNGVRYPMIAKKNDELRKDARCLDFCRMVNTLLLRDSEARRRQLHIRTYSVIPLQSRGGLIEIVPNLVHLRTAFASTTCESETMKRWAQVKTDTTKRRKFFDEIVEKNPVKMAEYLRKQFVDPCKWYGARLAFTRTAATMSMVGFILGLGDRHCENILIDSTNGDIVHVDFNILFNRGEFLPTPELVPFRLTRNMIDGFGPTGVEGAFRKTCETVMRVLRDEHATLCTVLETFVHDPLLEWSKVENRNQQVRGAQKNAVTPVYDGLETAIPLIKARLNGKIVTEKLYKQSQSSITMSVEGQVAQLIKMASDRKTLADMYFGWNPHL